jgi:hypothetical protein
VKWLGLRGKGGSLAEGAAKAAATGGEQDTNRDRPAAGKTEFRDERWMKNVVEGNTEEPSRGGFAVTGEDVIEVRLDGRSESAIVSGPQWGDASGSRLPSHRKDVISLLEVKGEADDIPAAAKGSAELSLRRILKNANAG